jgi:hypothetical protein
MSKIANLVTIAPRVRTGVACFGPIRLEVVSVGLNGRQVELNISDANGRDNLGYWDALHLEEFGQALLDLAKVMRGDPR